MSQILYTANGHSTAKTRLMYNVFLSYEQLKEYLAILVQSGLIELLEDSQTYKTTEKGLKFLNLLEYMEGEFMTAANHNPEIENKH